MKKTVELELLYRPLIEAPPQQVGDIWKNACAGDDVTLNTWKDTWIRNYKATKERFGELGEHSMAKFYNCNQHLPAIILASGPSLKDSLDAVKKNQEMRQPVLTLSALHNLGLFEDEGIYPDFYVSLDAGPIVIDDVSESRENPPEWYWEKTKDKKLLAYAASDPKLFDLWQGEIYIFSTIVPNLELRKAFDEIERFSSWVSSGGNAGGAMIYIAKALMGSSSLMLCGLDFCFDPFSQSFHSYKTHYDNQGTTTMWPTVYWNVTAKSWPSYVNFKFAIDYWAMHLPGEWVNCSGGILGAYETGNLKHYQYKTLHEALLPYWMSEIVTLQEFHADGTKKEKKIHLDDYWGNTKFDKDFTIF